MVNKIKDVFEHIIASILATVFLLILLIINSFFFLFVFFDKKDKGSKL